MSELGVVVRPAGVASVRLCEMRGASGQERSAEPMTAEE